MRMRLLQLTSALMFVYASIPSGISRLQSLSNLLRSRSKPKPSFSAVLLHCHSSVSMRMTRDGIEDAAAADDDDDDDSAKKLKEKRVGRTKKIPRIYIESSSLNLNMDVTLPEDTSHYVSNVMRMKPGDQLRVFNGIQMVDYLAEVRPTERRKGPVTLQILSPLKATSSSDLPKISVIFSPIKKPRLKILFEKLTELGVSSLIPLITCRTEARFESIARYQKNIIESCEQCERSSIPIIHDSVNLTSLMKKSTSSEELLKLFDVDKLLLCVERSPTSQPLLSALNDWQIQEERLGLVIGPEGGFTEEEVEYLKFAGNEYDSIKNGQIVPVSLGSNILRAETAGIYALSCVAGYQSSKT